VIQLVLWIVDSGCSKHMTGNLSLLRNFIEKFMGTVHFRNDHFTAITGYEDYVQGNLTICHNLEGDDFLTGSQESNFYTISISALAASSPKATSPLELSDNFATHTLDNNDTSSSSSIVVEEDEAPQIVSSSTEQVTNESNTQVLNDNINEFVQEDVAELDINVVYIQP
ncbi:hypothetical protein Tco_0235768, partial [Tanacetum coccineum]